MSGKKVGIPCPSHSEVHNTFDRDFSDREKFEYLYKKLKNVTLEHSSGESLDEFEKTSTAGESSHRSIEPSETAVQSDSHLDEDLICLTQQKIECLQTRVLGLQKMPHSEEDLLEIRQCITDRRILEESLMDIENISPEAYNFLRDYISETDSILELRWKPRILEYVHRATEELNIQISAIREKAEEVSLELSTEIDHLSSSSSWSYLSVGLKLITGVGIGILGALSLNKLISNESSSDMPSRLEEQDATTATSVPIESRLIFLTFLTDKINLFFSQMSYNERLSLRNSLSELMATPNYDHLSYLVDLEQMLSFL